MAVVLGNIYELSLKISSLGVNAYNVFQYEAIVASENTDGADLGEAWWNHVKSVYRALYMVSGGITFLSVVAKDLTNPVGLYGEFSVPTGERKGTRADPPQTELAPSFNAVGVRLTVGTRATRPGQKRLGCLVEDDLFGQQISTNITNLVTAWAAVVTEDMILGSPAALVTLRPVVVRRDAAGLVTAHQPVTGYLVNPNVTSQVSRKAGRGE